MDSGFTPYLTVRVDHRTRVPQGFVKDGQIVLNMDNDWVTFSARFGGVSHMIEVPMANVLAIYARETGEGMGFAAEGENADPAQGDAKIGADTAPGGEPPKPPRGRPQLTVVK